MEDCSETDYVVEFFDNLEQFAFYDDIKRFIESADLDKNTAAGQSPNNWNDLEG